MLKRLILTLAVITLVSLCPVFAQQTMPEFDHTADPDRDAIYAGVLGLTTQWKYHRFDRSHLIVWQHDSYPSRPSVAMFDRDGKQVTEVVVWFPEAVKVNLGDVALTKSGRLLVAGTAAKGDGAVADFIAQYDANGKLEHVIRTSPFVAYAICSSGDDSIWAYGWDRQGHRTGKYDVLREFGLKAGLKSSMLDRATLPKWYPMFGSSQATLGLRCGESTVSLYLGDVGELIAHDVNKPASLVRWHLPTLPDSVKVTGFALTDKGEFFASMNNTSKGQLYGLFHLQRTDPEHTRWVAVKNSLIQHSPEHTKMDLLGTEGDDLVYFSDWRRDLVTWVKIKPIEAKAKDSN